MDTLELQSALGLSAEDLGTETAGATESSAVAAGATETSTPAESSSPSPSPSPEAKPSTRDYSGLPFKNPTALDGLSEEELSDLKTRYTKYLPPEAVETARAEARILDHEKGYILTPEFSAAAEAHSASEEFLDSIEKAQIANAKGQSFTLNVPSADGKTSTPKTYKPSPEAGPILTQFYQKGLIDFNETKSAVGKIEQAHAASYKAGGKEYSDLAETISANFSKRSDWAEAEKQASEGLPKRSAGRPEHRLAQTAIAAGLIMMRENAELRKQLENRKAVAGAAPGSLKTQLQTGATVPAGSKPFMEGLGLTEADLMAV